MLSLSVSEASYASKPIARFRVPVVLAFKALNPTAVLAAAMLAFKASVPTAVLL